MSTGFESIQDLLADILSDVPIPRPPIPPDVVEAVTTVAVESFDAELLELVAHKGPLSPADEVTQGVTTPTFSDTLERQREEITTRIPMPTFIGSDLAGAMDIRNFATLVNLNTARWHAKVKDRKASADAAFANDADSSAFETRKRLLVGADDLLKTIHRSIDAARAKHYEMTLPWTTKNADDMGRRTGARLLPNTLFMEYTAEMARCKEEMQQALDAFVPKYPDLIEEARKKLGRRFDQTEYPNSSSIRGHFDLNFDFQPVPQGGDFRGLEEQQLQRLADTVNQKSEQMMENAMQEVWTRLYKAMTHMHERVSSPDKSFHHTLVENVRETTRLLKHLNVTNSTEIERIRIYLDRFITPHDTKDLRDNPALRSQVAGHVRNIINKMDKLGGGS